MRYYKICKKYFKLNANNKKLLLALFFSAFLRSFTVLGFPIFSAKIVDYATNGDFNGAFLNVLYLGINYLIYNIVYHWNYVAYRDNTNYVYNSLTMKCVEKNPAVRYEYTCADNSNYVYNSLTKNCTLKPERNFNCSTKGYTFNNSTNKWEKITTTYTTTDAIKDTSCETKWTLDKTVSGWTATGKTKTE